MRRTLIIAAVVIVVLGVAAIIYFYFFAKPATITTAPSAGLPVAGQGAAPPGGTTTGIPAATPGTPTSVTARLVRISAGPVVPGEVAVNRAGNASSSPETTVNYIERQSGNVFSYSSSAKTITRTSNKTIPGIQSASWLPNASTAFVRYLSGKDFSTINTYALPASGSAGFFLSQNLADVAVSSISILMLSSGVNGSVASLANIDGTHASQIFSTPLSAIDISFAGKNQYLAYTKPSSSLEGDAFLIDGAGHFSRISGPREGLVALASPLGKWVLVSYTVNDAMQMGLVNTVTDETLSLPTDKEAALGGNALRFYSLAP